ncbi:class I SAM-dependent methyltransferase [Arcanobacterium ihumii]|uniref:class I SAM-dependent methyltransferase n=1 Tax=Arcanobacterium ihumii TaxID=2138162 RepID=UPI001356D030|nr:class I SAM-dependent methyltransferase [Arcanobacterium ihumii]
MSNPFEGLGRCTTQSYIDVRPSYPQESVSKLGLTAAKTCADIGSGTGKLTQRLIHTGAKVWAVEPSEEMREAFHLALPEFPTELMFNGTAENTGLASSSLDVVTYGQCWHWLNQEAASCEASRILKDDGVVAIFYNQLDVSILWVHRLTRIMRSGDVHRFDQAPELSHHFSAPELTVFEWEDQLSVTEVFELGTTRSSWIKSSEENRKKMRANLSWYLYEHLGYDDENPVSLPYHTYLWRARKN